MTRTIHPAVQQYELWPGPAGYPWAASGIRLWTREGILRRVAPDHLICTWTTGGFSEPTEGNFTMISRSRDDGRTWSTPEVLFRHAHRGLFTTELFVPREGEVHAFLQTYALGAWMTQLDSYRSISRDGGLTWSCPNSIPGGIQNVWVNSGIVHSSGRWIIPVSWAEHCGDEWCEPSIGRPPAAVAAGPAARQPVELPWGADKLLLYQTANAWADRNHRYVAGVMLSDDGGATFRLRGYLCRDDARHFIEPKVVELSDGRLVLFSREKWQGWIWRSESADGGETWSPMPGTTGHTIERTDIPNPSSKFRLLRASNGRIFLLHNPASIQPDGKWGRRSPLSLWISDDDMRTWRTKVDLVADDERNLNYPDGFLDEERAEVRFAWEDAYSVYVAAVPMDVGETKDQGRMTDDRRLPTHHASGKDAMTTPMQEALRRRAQLTRPDYIAYIPSSWDEAAYDRVNEHFLTFDGPDGSLMAVWTQEFVLPGQGNINHTIFSRSVDEGATWAPPRVIAGPKSVDDPVHMTSWAFPLVSKSGRIYVIYNRHTGVVGWIRFHTGGMGAVYSDDCGATWSAPQEIAMPRSPYDDPAGVIPPEWIVWQKPLRDLSGGYFVGYSHWVNRAVATLKEVKDWTEIESVVEFMRFTNVDDDPAPRDLDIRYTPPERALRVPHRMHPLLSIAQEPSLVRLPDDRLFCVMRTCSGAMWWSQSADDGETWCSPRPLLHRDFGLPLLNPVASDPIYPLSEPGRYVLFYHNNIGGPAAGGAMDAMPREPVYISLGEFRPRADQPVWFSQPKLFMATEGIAPDGVTRSLGDTKAGSLSMYASFTNRNGVDVLWYPDSKFFLLGKRITAEGLAAPRDLEHEGTK